MRDQKRIKRILTKLEIYWNKYPDLRLGQLIVNQIPSERVHPFFFEDDDLERELDNAIKISEQMKEKNS